MLENMMPVQSATALARSHETAVATVTAQAQTMVEARWLIAHRRPRNWDQVRQDIIRECERPSFANNKSAFYRKPIGKGVEGLGIRFVEVAIRCMNNVLIESPMLFEDDMKEILRVMVTELETNTTYSADVKVSKTVERSKPMDDGTYLSVRKNSQGDPVYTVFATDDDLLNKRAALVSKAVRTLGLRVIPGDLQDEAEEIIKRVRQNTAAKDPDAERKRIADAFGEIGVKASQLQEYLGHDLGTCSPNELVDLRGLYGAIRDGETSWRAVMEAKAEESGTAAEKGRAPGAGGVGDINTRIAAAKKQQQQAAAAAAPPAATAAASAPTYAEVRAAIEEANRKKEPQDMDEAVDLIRSLPEQYHEELKKMAADYQAAW